MHRALAVATLIALASVPALTISSADINPRDPHPATDPRDPRPVNPRDPRPESDLRNPRPQAGAPDLPRILSEIKSRDKGQLAVSEEDGRFLRLLIASSRAKRALEIGGASGYSAIWMGMGLRETGGTLVTIEYDPERAKELAANIKRAGLSDIVTVVAGDAFAQLPAISGAFDFVFLDAWKKDYKRFFDLMLPRLNKGGLFVAHNVVNKRSEMGDFLDAIWKNPSLWTTIVSPSSEGMSISLKR